jgi:hypothetical protein
MDGRINDAIRLTRHLSVPRIARDMGSDSGARAGICMPVGEVTSVGGAGAGSSSSSMGNPTAAGDATSSAGCKVFGNSAGSNPASFVAPSA